MKIALYSHSVSPSIDGVCRRFTAIFKELTRLGHELLIFTIEDNPEDLPSSATVVTLNHFYMPAYPGKKVAQPDFQSLSRIWNALNNFRPDVVHITADALSQMFAFVGTILDIPVVGSFHTDLIDLLTTHDAFTFQKWSVMLLEYVDSIILDSCATTSVSFAKKLEKQGLSCEHIINTAVDVNIFHPKLRNNELRNQMMFGDENGTLCVYVGRISREKRIDIIVDAIQKLDGVYLAIIGDGPSGPYYSGLHGKENKIFCQPKFLNHEALAEVYASSDLHVSASEFETLGNTVLESFACSVPVVVAKTQGFSDTVKDSYDGFLFNPGDSDHAKELIVKLINNKKLRAQMGERARAKMMDRTIDKVVQDILKWYYVGISKHKEMSRVKRIGRFLILTFFIPFAMFLLVNYQFIGNLMAPKKYMYDPVKKQV